MEGMSAHIRNSRGFTLAELVAVLVLMGIVGVAVYSRLDIASFRTAGFEQELKAALRFAQKFALTSGCDVQVDIVASSNSYALSLRNDAVVSTPPCPLGASGAFGTSLNNPAGGIYAGVAAAGVNVGNNLSFFYDRQGRPSIAGGTTTIDGRTITVEAVTGYVY